MDRLDWNDLRVLLAVADEGTLTAAARRLGTSQPTVGRRLAALEAAAGVPLVARLRTGYTLTAEGERLQVLAKELARRMNDLARGSLADGGLAGTVKIAVTETTAMQLVTYLLPALAKSHPQIEIDLVTGNRQADVAGGEVDLAIRLVPPSGGLLVARKLGIQRYSVFASPAYLERSPFRSGSDDPANDVSAFAGHSFLYPAGELLKAPPAPWFEALVPKPECAFATNSLPVIMTAAEAGFGLAILPNPIGEDCVRKGSLVRVLALPRGYARDIFLVQHEDARQIPRVRAVAEAVAATMIRLLEPV
jgi:DNA-binding transcriptional LysR family regulator